MLSPFIPESTTCQDNPLHGAPLAFLAGGASIMAMAPIPWSLHQPAEPCIVLAGHSSLSIVLLLIVLLLAAGLTRLRRKRGQLERALEELRKANVYMNRLLATISHEIRTPLNSILGYTEILNSSGSSEGDRALALGVVERNCHHLLDLVGDVLDISKIEAGEVEVEKVEFSLAQVLRDVVSVMWVKAQKNGTRLQEIYETPIPERIVSDPTRLRQILINLVGNAVKFTEQGVVRLLLGFERRMPAEDSVLQVRVMDTGCGIPADKLESIFQPFHQIDAVTARKYGGTGLGLAISREIARLLGGSISVESTLGEGSTFTLRIRCRPAKETRWLRQPSSHAVLPIPPNAELGMRLEGRVLLVDDSADNRRLLRYHLRNAGVSVETARDGSEAIEAIAAGGFDLVFMDVQMPVMDGFQAIRELRRRGFQVPVVALTAHAMKGDRERCLDAGFVEYLSKPVTQHLLVRMAANFLRRDAGGGSVAERCGLGEPLDGNEAEEIAGSGAPSSGSSASGELPAELVLEYVESLQEDAAAIAKACGDRDWPRLTNLAHRIKGSGAGFGFAEISEVAADVERLLASGRHEEGERRARDLEALCRAQSAGAASRA
jgi:signal transduction histidine kinase/CheY-like chemotaxis protein/HPt (histidine-containing phosphotransfer) domain-containing protein